MESLSKEPNSVLLLEDGVAFSGWSFGSQASAFGEVVFNTAHCGYQEVLTDPSYHMQLVAMTYPHQGNYGVNPTDIESEGGVKVAGFLVHQYCDKPSNFTATESLGSYLKKNNIPALYGIDTRKLTLHLRSSGSLRGFILPVEEYESLLKAGNSHKNLFKGKLSFKGLDLIKEVTTKSPYWYSKSGDKTVAVLDYGVKLNLLRNFKNRNCKVIVLPAQSSAKDVLSYSPDGVFLSNGPGDPAAAEYAVQTVRELIGKKPIFGVCMGHQILALALGASTFKMKFGHHGVNQPVLNLANKKVEISSHNHGFTVDAKTLPAGVRLTHRNLNDDTCEGLEAVEHKAFSVQYHPESAPGPHDSDYLFDKFIKTFLY